ncbi:MAG: oligopeptidase B, partial [Flavobacteriales bacterium]|nr:oligopeptidase B [Flavobacteriales bacterium]
MHLPEVPKAAKIPVTLSIHDDLRIDPYYWMQERENPEVRKYLNAENKYTEQVMAPVKNLRQTLYTEMRSRIKETDMSVPYFDRGYFYYVRYEEGMEHPVYCRKKENLEAPEEIILDANDRAKGHDFYKVSGLCVSPDNRML